MSPHRLMLLAGIGILCGLAAHSMMEACISGAVFGFLLLFVLGPETDDRE